jgi:outer membrane receptor protein involved in Fe transport
LATDRLAVICRVAASVVLASALSAPAMATAASALDLPAGRLGDVVTRLSQQAGVSIVVDNPALWQRPTPALKGRFTVEAALKRLLADSGAEAVPVAGDGWRIRKAAAKVVRRVPVPPIVVAEPGTIVVTASKRDLRLRDFPGAVSVLSGDDLKLSGPPDTNTILSRLATVSSTHLGAGRNKLFIRGIADSSFTGPTQATVGQYFGDIRLTYNAPDPDLRLYDVGSVEVLEGPQGTLYGAGSLGGIIRVVPNTPSLSRASGSIDAGATIVQHGDVGGDLSAMLNLPLVDDKVGLRVVGYGISDGGYIDNPLRDKKNINRTNTAGGRATLRIAPGDGWTIDLTGIVQNTDGLDSQYADRDAPRLTRSSPIDEDFSAAYRLGELVVSKDWDKLHFRSTTGFVGQDLDERFDATPPDGSPQVFTQHNRTRLFSSEARLWQPLTDSVGWVIGGSVLHNETTLNRALGPDGMTAPVTGVENRVTELTLYGEASVRLAPWLSLSGGARVSHSELSGGADDAILASSLVEALARADITASRDTTSVLPSLALVATALPGLTFYARYQQGFRPGGLAIDNNFVRRFDNDKVATEEGGFRYGVPGRDRFDFAMSVSHTLWRNIQADFLDTSGLPSTDNIGDGRIWSIAASGGWQPIHGLRFDASIAYNDGRVTKPSASYQALAERYVALIPVSGTFIPGTTVTAAQILATVNRIPNVARFTGRVGFDWQQKLTDTLGLRLNGWGRYVGKSRLGIGPVLGEAQGDYADSALTLRVGTPATGVSLGVTNLTDSVGNRFALGTPFTIGRDQITPLRPRTFRLGFDAAF